jgi:hypothetical protein
MAGAGRGPLADDKRFAGAKRDRGLEGSFGRSREESFAGVKRDPSSWSGEILRRGQESFLAGLG